MNIEFDNVNKVEIEKLSELLDENYLPNISILPRTKDPKYVQAAKKKKRIKWTFPISIFAKWRPDDDELIRKCFETDWENCKI